MRIGRIRTRKKSRDYIEISARITSKLLRSPFTLSYTFNKKYGDYVSRNGDAFVIAALPICACYNEPLYIEEPVSDGLLRQIPSVLDKFIEFFPSFSKIPIIPSGTEAQPADHDKDHLTACMFSLGLDSLYTLFKNADEIDLLIMKTSEHDDWAPAYERMVVAATVSTLNELGSHADLLVVRSNIWKLSEGLVDLGKHYHGAALISLANLFSAGIRKTFIGGSFPYDALRPWGSHPDLDVLWSTESMEIVHDSPIRRLDKCRALAEKPQLFEYLRVCPLYLGDRFNCGWCPKCVSMSINLYACGVLDYCKTLPQTIPVERLRHIPLAPIMVGFMDLDRWLEALGDSPEDQRLRWALLERRADWDVAKAKRFVARSAQSWELAKCGDIDEAKTMIRELLEEDSYDSELHFHLGYCLAWHDRQTDEAIQSFEKARYYGYDEFLVSYQIALTHVFRGDIVRGFKLLSDARKLKPGGFEWRAMKDFLRWVMIRIGLYRQIMKKVYSRKGQATT
jgi:hypothetical protein